MTMIDDDTLTALFAQAAAAFDTPASGPANVLAGAFGPTGAGGEEGEDGADGTVIPPKPVELTATRVRRLRALAGAHRVLSVAAVFLVAIAIAGGATWLGRTTTQHVPSIYAAQDAGGVAGTQLHSLAAPQKSSLGAAALGGDAVGSTTGGSSPASSSVINGSLPPTPVQGSSSGTASGTGAASAAPTTSTPPGVGQSTRIEQTGSLSLTVAKGSLSKTMTQLSFLAGAYNGFVATSQTQSGAEAVSGVPSGTITIEVPEASFSDVVKKAQALGTTQALTTKATDVTGQYVDLQSRLTALQDSRQQYLTIMAKANSTGDVLAVQAQLDNIQSQIEQVQGQLQLLGSQTDFSTLTVSASERAPAHHHTAPGHRSGLATAWHASVHGFVRGFEDLVRVAGPALFVLLCGLVLALGGRAGWRRYQRHNL